MSSVKKWSLGNYRRGTDEGFAHQTIDMIGEYGGARHFSKIIVYGTGMEDTEGPKKIASRIVDCLNGDSTTDEKYGEACQKINQLEVELAEANAALWRVQPNTHTLPPGKPDPFEGEGETYHDAYHRLRAENLKLRTALAPFADIWREGAPRPLTVGDFKLAANTMDESNSGEV